MLKYILNNLIKVTFFNQWNYFNSWTKCKSVTADAWIWYLRLDHAESQSLQYLVTCFKNAWIQKMKDSIIIDYNNCAVRKIKWKVCYELRFNEENSEEYLIINFHNFKLSFEDFISLVIITDCWSDFIWDFYLSNCTSEIIIKLLTFFFDFLQRQYKIELKVMKINEKLYTQKLKIRKFLEQSIRVESSLLYTQALNSSDECSENVIKQKIIVMKNSFNLLKKLWLEIICAAIYLYNWTSCYFLNWKSSYELFHTHLTHQDDVIIEEWKS